jgi:hypothetical protein
MAVFDAGCTLDMAEVSVPERDHPGACSTCSHRWWISH